MAGNKDEDLTGQSRFTWNLFVSWLSQLVLIFSGFVMPRLVDDRLGQIALGIWDFGWAFVSYLTLIGFGMGASFNRFIAQYRAANQIQELNEVANSVVFVQVLIASLVCAATYSFYLLLPYFFQNQLGSNTLDAQWVVLFLGMSLAIQMVSGSARGLLTGYHRWDIHNTLHALHSFSALLLMVFSLSFTQFGIVGMAFCYLIATAIFEGLRFVAVKLICKQVQFSWRFVYFSRCVEMFMFGIKSMLSNLPPILLLQTVNIMLVNAIGPAALAVFSRPMALTKQVTTFMNKFTLMLSPTTGSMQGLNDDPAAIRELFIAMTKLSFAFCIPTLAFLAIYGDVILNFWMGDGYALWALIAILAIGQILPIGQDSAIRILMGMNQHGKISILAFISVIVIFGFLLIVISNSDWQLSTAAILFIVPMNLVYGLLIPYFTCQKLQLSWSVYISKTLLSIVALTMPYLGLMILSRYSFSSGLSLYALMLFIAAIVVTGLIYYKKLVPETMKSKLHKRLPKFLTS